MTEQEWIAERNPDRMLQHFDDSPPWRKLRLIGCACLRTIWELIPEGELRSAVVVAEKFAEGMGYTKEFEDITVGVDKALEEFWHGTVHPLTKVDYHTTRAVFGFFRWVGHERMALCVAVSSRKARGRIAWRAVAREDDPTTLARAKVAMDIAEGEEAIRQCKLLHEIIGDPFHPPSIDSECLTPDVISLAHSAYDNRRLPSGYLDPDRLAVLSDALEEAGCDNATVLEHLRGPGPHVRGCWALDLILEKG